jgi:hypothetical protein
VHAADRFGHWPPLLARAALVGIVVLLILAAVLHPDPVGEKSGIRSADVALSATPSIAGGRDLALYDRIIERVAGGESYYPVAIEEQRARNFPVRPGVAVRLPTLAHASAWLGPTGLTLAASALWLGLLIAWWRRLGIEPGGLKRRVVAMLLVVIGTAIAFKPQYLFLHEVWAGALVALSFALHRPGRWLGSLVAAALALAIREHALPFVLLMGAWAIWHRRWAEAGAWVVLVLHFAAGLAVHVATVTDYLTAQDRPSPSWLALRGLAGFTSDVILSSILYRLPPVIAAPLAVLPLLGWAGWRSAAGAFGALYFGGYAIFLMLAGRENNFYWALMITPVYFVGLAFVPMALRSLWQAAKGRRAA